MSYESRSVRDAVEEINRTYFLPAIQREFVWDTFRVEKLFDSIMGKYPIGSFLFWKVKEENKKDWISYDFIRHFDQENPHNDIADLSGVNKDVYFVLDGQQRLSALNIGLRGSYSYFYYRQKTTELYLNLLKPLGRNEKNPEELEFQFKFRESPQTDNPENEFWYKVGNILDFLDSEDAKADIKTKIAQYNEQQQTNAMKLIGLLHSMIHTYKLINYYEEKSQDYDKVVEVFIRANTGGKTLEYSDILLSTATAKWKKLNAREEINIFTDDINTIGIGYEFGKDFVLKGSLYLTDGLPIQYKVGNFTKSNLEKIEDNWQNIKFGIESSIKLISKYGFSNKNITAPIALLPVAYYLMKLAKKNYTNSSNIDDVQSQNLIQKWLILTLLKNSFGGSTDNTLTNLKDEMAIVNDYSNFPFNALNKKLAIGPNFTDEELEKHLSANYKSKYSYLILSLLYPDRDWKDNLYHEDHIFPKSYFTSAKLKARGYDDNKVKEYQTYFNTIINLQLLTDSENLEKNAIDFEAWINTRDLNFKNRHSIPIISSYHFDNFISFIDERRKILNSKLKTL